MSDATLFLPDDFAKQRAQLRKERQARVGILRNPNAPPRPPTRKTNLMGKWINLRSSRRPRAGHVKTAIESLFADVGVPAEHVETVVRTSNDGSVHSIDIGNLMKSVAGVGVTKPIRTPYGDNLRPDREAPVLPSAPAPAPSILTREAWLDGDLDDLAQRAQGQTAAPECTGAADERTLAERLRAATGAAMRAVAKTLIYLFVGLVLAVVLLGIASAIVG